MFCAASGGTTWISLRTDSCVCLIRASASLRSCWTSTARSLLCETQRRRLWHPKLNFQLLSGSVFSSIRRLIEVSLWAAPLPIYFSIIPADKYFDVSMFCVGGVSVTWKSHKVEEKLGVFVLSPSNQTNSRTGDTHSRSVSHQAPLHFLIFVKPKTITTLQVCLLDARETKVKRKSDETFSASLQTCRDDCRWFLLTREGRTANVNVFFSWIRNI